MNLLTFILSAISTITVASQADFDAMPQRLRNEISSGAGTITVEFRPGMYLFREEHVAFNDLDKPELSLRFVGYDATLVAAGRDVKSGEKYRDALDWRDAYLDEDMTDVNPWSRFYEAAGAVEVVDFQKKLCRVRSDGLDVADRSRCQDSYIQVTQWFKSSVYPVVHVRDSWVYFTADDLAKVKLLSYNVNDDIVYGGAGVKPRFRVFNLDVDGTLHIESGRVVLPEGVGSLHICKSNYAFFFNNCKFKLLEISGLNFAGNHINRVGSALIRLYGMESGDIDIHNCRFGGIMSYVITVNETSGVRIRDNRFTDIHSCGVYAYSGAASVKVCDNIFENCGLSMSNTPCILCACPDYSICGNVLRNFGSWGISAGGWHKGDYAAVPYGVIEFNELYYDADYAADFRQHTLMDTGAIYLYTLNSRAYVRCNNIHDYCGMKDNRGIFCDDGARGFTLHSNVVRRIANSYCIDSRREKVSEDVNGPNNVDNVVTDNVVDGPVRFEGNDARRDCVCGPNWILPASAHGLPETKIRNMMSERRDIILDGPDDRKLRKHADWQTLSDYLK